MRQMFLPIFRVFLGETGIVNDQQVFRVVFLCRFGEVETSRQTVCESITMILLWAMACFASIHVGTPA
jgi:hypothetical protein